MPLVVNPVEVLRESNGEVDVGVELFEELVATDDEWARLLCADDSKSLGLV